jgi:hypothetical protein
MIHMIQELFGRTLTALIVAGQLSIIHPTNAVGVRTLVVPEDCQKNDDWDWNAQSPE